jgi:hypothetical protein
MLFEILVQNTVGAKENLHSLAIGKLLEVAAQNEPIKPVQNTEDKSRKDA